MNISELHRPKYALNMINNFGEIVPTHQATDNTFRGSENKKLTGPTTKYLNVLELARLEFSVGMFTLFLSKLICEKFKIKIIISE